MILIHSFHPATSVFIYLRYHVRNALVGPAAKRYVGGSVQA